MRLDKLLSHSGFGSRKEVKQLLKKGQVAVNELIVKDGKFSVNPDRDNVRVGQEIVSYQANVYFLLNKPAGVISATEDKREKTVVDLLKTEDFRKDIFPVGRLDKDTTGLLLLTNDGKLAHELLSPKKHIEKVYTALVSGIMTEKDVRQFKEGIIISGGEKCLPAELTITSVDEEKKQCTIALTLVEGKFHQVKRMVAATGNKVEQLERVKMGSLLLDDELAYGAYRPLTAAELSALKTTET